MKIAIEILKKELKNQKEDLQVNKRMLKDKTNGKEMNLYFEKNIIKNQKAIVSIKKTINYLKNGLRYSNETEH